MKTFLIGTAAAAALAAGAAAFAQATPATPPAAKAAKVETRADLQARVAKAFERLDTNKDGFISKDELSAIEAQREQKAEQRAQNFDPSKIFDRIDANHDGKITVAEQQAARSAHTQTKGGKPAVATATSFTGLFAKTDANKDNVITRAEFDAMGQQLKARMEKASATRGGRATRMFEMADANKDGRVSLAEMQQQALAQFDKADANHDGKLSPEERQQARQLLKGQKKPS